MKSNLYEYYWNQPKFKGRLCKILARENQTLERGEAGKVLVEFTNGQQELVSKRALRSVTVKDIAIGD